MKLILAATCWISLLFSAATVRADAPTVDLEVAVDSKAPFAAQQRWYDLLKPLELNSLRVRGARPREEPRIESTGAERRPGFRVLAILDAKNQLRLPAATFSQRDVPRLVRYLETLREEGVDGATEPRGPFGLTRKQFQEVLAELSEPLGVSTKDQRPRELVDATADRIGLRLVVSPHVLRRLDEAEPAGDELAELSRGTALAILLREAGLVFGPHIQDGELLYQIDLAGGDAFARHEPPRLSELMRGDARQPDIAASRARNVLAIKHWPVGWTPEATPSRTAPDLFDQINAEIGGYSLAEALEAIRPRLKTPLLVDRGAVTARKIDLSKTAVQLPPGKYSYLQILDGILHSSHLHGTMLVDERGAAFYWIGPDR